MMTVLLVQLPTSHLGAQEKVYPLGLARLASTLPKAVDKMALDLNLEPDPWPVLAEVLAEFAPAVVAYSFRNLDPLAGQQSSYLSSLKTAATLTRQRLPRARILAGGPAFSLFGQRLMAECPEIDVGLIGEGECSFPHLVRDQADLPHIPGILWREHGQLQANAPGPPLDLAQLPPLDLTAFAPQRYLGANAYVAAMGIEGKRGCDLCCGYCLYPKLGGHRVRLRPPGQIVDEMELLVKEHGVRLLHFTDPVVNRPADHFAEFCKKLSRRRLDCAWTGFFREDLVSHDNLALARDTGLGCVNFSADALTDRGLRLLGKQMTMDEVLAASRTTTDLGLLTVCHFLVNLPGDNEEEIDQARAMLDRLLAIHHRAGNLGAVIFNPIRLYPGAPLTRRLLAEGGLDSRTDLLYPVYHDPPRYSHVRHEFANHCHLAGVLSRLEAGS